MERNVVMLLLMLTGLSAPLDGQDSCTTDWQLTEGLRIGSLDGPDALTGVRSLAIGPNGNLYVTQYLLGSVMVFSADGRLVRTIGRTGQGPGEFENSPSRVTWLGDTLWVADQFRSQSFGPDGRPDEFVRFRVSMPQESARYTPGLPLADGSFWAHRWLSPQLGAQPYGPGTERIAVRRFSASGEVLGTIAVIDMGVATLRRRSRGCEDRAAVGPD